MVSQKVKFPELKNVREVSSLCSPLHALKAVLGRIEETPYFSPPQYEFSDWIASESLKLAP